MYIGYVQFLLIMFVFIKSLGENSFTDFVFTNSAIAIPTLLLAFILFSLIVGYLDSRLGLREEEIKNFSKSNPVLMDIQKSISVLGSQIGRLEEQLDKSNINES
jgi:hypothetical protein